jgi:phosphonate transport system substrate-binding protein
MLLRRWKDGVPEYRSLFIARRDNDIQGIGDLVGRTLAFEDRGSTTAYFMPAVVLRDAGFDLVELQAPNLTAPPGKIGYVFARSEVNIAVWAARGLVAAGALDSVSWDDPGRALRAARAELRVFHESAPLLRAVELVRGNLAPAIRERLSAVLRGAHLDPHAAGASAAYSMTTRFDEFVGEAADRLAEARRTFHWHRWLLA